MGCVASRIDKEERVRICKERRMLMKQLAVHRESESLELENTTFGIALPPSPPPPLPPSPPPPPNFSPDSRKFEYSRRVEVAQEEIIEMNEENSCTPPPPPVPSSSWDFWDPFAPSSPHCEKKSEVAETIEEENWAEANTEFEEEQEEDIFENEALNLLPEKPRTVELIDDNSSMVSWHTKDTADMAMVIWRSKKTLAGIIKELDDYFLKASAGGKDIVLLVDINSSDTFIWQEEKRIRCSSANVFNALTWSWSSKSLQCTRSAAEFYGPSEPCRLGAHSITLEKLYVEEQRLYKDIKDEEITKLEHEKKSLLLQKQEVEDRDWTKTEKTRLSVESLQSDVISLKESISRSCSSILKVIDEELHPQLNHHNFWTDEFVENNVRVPSSSESHIPAGEPSHKSGKREYVRALCRWIRLTYCFVEDCQQSGRASAVHGLCQEWQQALDRLPDKVASEAIKSFLSAIQSIVLQQQEELNLKKKSDKLERKLQRELNSLAAMEIKLVETSNIDDANSGLSPKHPLFVKRAKVETLTKRVNEEKAKYLNSVRATKAMTLNNLRTSLPNVFQALMGFSSAYTQTLEAMLSHTKPVDSDGTFSPMC
ncbi:benzoyl-CoA reductase subunit C, putative [Actinidia rufa]|uniref:Benzoyl-CoA reductase subunit C, putative n=1 Tax=Actinidia rufa TaxID=165716 RepID=A0A7J0G5L7_9ERIC|nr:benzoyl-CoA reductase subunit C, putative [Actinidia rufa]